MTQMLLDFPTSTQNEKVLAFMRERGSITALDAVRFGCFRLGARIYDLKRQGYKIESKLETVNKKTFARYRLKENL